MKVNKDIGVFIDLDGCWADTEPSHWVSWRDAVLPYGIMLTWEDFVKNAKGHTDKEVLKLYLERTNPSLVPENPGIILERKLEIFLDIARKDCLVPRENIDLIKRLKGFNIALVTSSTLLEVDAALYPTGLKDPFKVIVSQDDVEHYKPDPEPYLIAKSRLGVSEGIAFEDSESGIRSATAAGGLTVIKVPNPLELSRLVKRSLGI